MTMVLDPPTVEPAITAPVIPAPEPQARTYPIEECVAWLCTTPFGPGRVCGHRTWGSQKPTGTCPGCGRISS